MAWTIVARCSRTLAPRHGPALHAARWLAQLARRRPAAPTDARSTIGSPFMTRSISSAAGPAAGALAARPGLMQDRAARRRSSGSPRGAGMRMAYIALGSNLGDRVGWIERACNEMDARGIRVRRTSSLWETEPMYVLDQNRFVNGACEVETSLEPLALLDQLQDIERTLGRRKTVDKGPRNIDLDILLYEDVKFSHERLTIPHVAMHEREFVLRPLAELIPDRPIDYSQPWKLTVDYLNALPPSDGLPLTTLTPLTRSTANHGDSQGLHSEPGPCLQALRSTRRTHVMAILNMTPDSFSDGGRHGTLDTRSLEAAVRGFVDAGATMIDIGGQSTAPGAPEVSAEEEMARVLPAVRLARKCCAHDGGSRGGANGDGTGGQSTVHAGGPTPPARPIISVDTYRASVAEAAIAAGADMVNDVSAGALDADMLPTVARLDATMCLMHMRGTPATMSSLADYPAAEGGLVAGIARELGGRIAAAEAAGVRRWRIVLDPGLGFAKAGRQDVDVLRRLRELREWPGMADLPWLVGPSRKSFIGRVTGASAPRDRIWGTAAAVAAAVQAGADIVRIHDVREMAQVVTMADAIWRH